MAKLRCFVVMPFGHEFDSVFQAVREAATNAVSGEAIDCHWLKDVVAAGRITDDILHALHNAALCVADVTGGNPNVMWETGYAMALGKPTILIGQRVEELPFDLKVHRVLPYSPQTLGELGSRLAEAIRQTLARYEVKPRPMVSDRVKTGGSTVVVTGSMLADSFRVNRRINELLGPYLGSGAMWYCGAAGTVDDYALKYLLAHGERVAAVAHSRHTVSGAVRESVQAGKVPWIDASIEPLPKGLTGPTPRDIFFCLKADLIVLLWDGESKGIQILSQYFMENGKNLLIGFI